MVVTWVAKHQLVRPENIDPTWATHCVVWVDHTFLCWTQIKWQLFMRVFLRAYIKRPTLKVVFCI